MCQDRGEKYVHTMQQMMQNTTFRNLGYSVKLDTCVVESIHYNDDCKAYTHVLDDIINDKIIVGRMACCKGSECLTRDEYNRKRAEVIPNE
jgi:hypothetical protein